MIEVVLTKDSSPPIEFIPVSCKNIAMKTFTRDYRISGGYPDRYSEYFNGLNTCVFDIESTGLDPSRSKVCLVAMLTLTDAGVRITQFLAENHYEENRVLDAAMEFFEEEGTDCLITFNGMAFDVPFMNRRLEANFAGSRIDMYDFDLYRFLRRGTDLKDRIGSLSQKSVEDHYGICSDRQDTITGRESVTLFDQYALSGNSTIEKIILTHNREDVLQLHRLMQLTAGEPEDFDAAMALHGFPVLGGRLTARPYIRKSKKVLCITGEQLRDTFSAVFYPDMDSPVTAEFNQAASSYEISAPVGRLNDEYYIDLEPLGLTGRLSDDPQFVNGYLILDPRSINLVSGMIVEDVAKRCSLLSL